MFLQEQLKDLMLKNELTQGKVSSALGLGVATLNQWLAEKYEGNVERVDKAVSSFLIRQQEKASQKRHKIQFCQTSVSSRVWGIARICHLENEIGLCYGDAGLGKTYAVKEYAEQNPDVILVEADLGFTAKVLFSVLHKACGFTGFGVIHSMFEDVVDKLKDSGRLIIIDEAEHLPYRSLEMLRRLYDKANIGILFIGMPRLLSNLKGKKGEYAQLYSRVGVAGKVEQISLNDTAAIVKAIVPGAKDSICIAYHECSHGNTRILSKLILRSLRIAESNNRKVDREIIQETGKMLII